MDKTQDNGLGMDNMLMQGITDALQTATENGNGEGLAVLAGLLLTRVLFIQWYTKGQLEACAQALRSTAEADSKKTKRSQLRTCIADMAKTALALGKAAEGGITVDGGLTINTAHGLKALARGLHEAAEGGRTQDIENAETQFFGMPLEALWRITDEIAERLTVEEERLIQAATERPETARVTPHYSFIPTDQVSKKLLPVVTPTANPQDTPTLDKETLVAVFWINPDEIALSRQLDYCDLRLISACDTLYLQGKGNDITYLDIYRQYAYGDTVLKDVAPDELLKLEMRIQCLRVCWCKITSKEPYKKIRDVTTGEYITRTANDIKAGVVYSNPLIWFEEEPAATRRKAKNGGAVLGKRLNIVNMSPIAKYAFAVGQYLLIPQEVMELGGKTTEGKNLNYYMLSELKRIEALGNHGECGVTAAGLTRFTRRGVIRLDTMFNTVGDYIPTEKNTKGEYTWSARRARESRLKMLGAILEGYKSHQIIVGYELDAEKVTIVREFAQGGRKNTQEELLKELAEARHRDRDMNFKIRNLNKAVRALKKKKGRGN